MGHVGNVVTHVAFVVLAAAGFLPGRSRSLLDATLRWIQDNDRPIVIVVGLAFGIL
jgi:hypothetical protein